MDKAYLTAGPAIVDVLDGASVGWLWTRRCLRKLVYTADKRDVKQLITIVQSPSMNNVYKMLLKTKGECQYGISFY